MSKIIIIIISLIFLQSYVNQLYSQDFSKIDKIVIDAGHGGKDPGTVGKHSKEKEVALSIALKLGALINENLKDVEITYTRKTDVFIELYRRAEIANKAKADLFISIHCNSVDGPSARGTETWIMGTHRNDKNLEVAKKENSAILLESDYSKNYDNFDPNSPESYITLSLIQSAYREQSMSLADRVQKQFTEKVHRVDRGVKEAGFLVLVYTTMPSILIETGFLSNPEEEKFLLSEQGQDYIASAIYRAFRDYKKSIEGNTVTTNVVAPVIAIPPKLVEADTIKKNDLTKSEVFFGVQFTTRTSNENDKELLKDADDVWIYEQNGRYKYVSGHYDSYKEATKMMKSIKSGKYKDAFVVAFIDGKRVSRAEAEKAQKERD